MKRFKILASCTTDLFLEVEAESEQDVWDKIRDGEIDGGDFADEPNGENYQLGDVFSYRQVVEVNNEELILFKPGGDA